MSSNIPLVTGSYPARPTGFTKVDYAVTWNIQVAFCKIIGQFDSGPPMLEEPQSPALPIVVFQVLRELPHLAMHCLDLAPVRVSPPPDGPRFCPEQGQVAQPVVFAPPLPQFLLRFSADFPEGVRGSRIL